MPRIFLLCLVLIALRLPAQSPDPCDSILQTAQLLSLEFIAQAEASIYGLNYASAAISVEKASRFDVAARLRPQIERLWIEVIFWYRESRQPEQAEKLENQARLLDFPVDLAPKSWLDTLQARYYPAMMPVEGGLYTLGCDKAAGDKGCNDKKYPPHPVQLSDFHIAQTETTLWQFSLYCAAEGLDIADYARTARADWGLRGPLPVIEVSWYDAAAYANWLNKKWGRDTAYVFHGDYDLSARAYPDSASVRADLPPGASIFRLPTEAQWEYAARGGQKASQRNEYSGADSLGLVAWYFANSEGRIRPVAQKAPNELGLYDMSGNVWEWGEDWFGADYYAQCVEAGIVADPRGPAQGEARMLRGGSWYNNGWGCRPSFRYNGCDPQIRSYDYGFRLSSD
jgi:formylglycine-generating enzyme required for sulfatase activity